MATKETATATDETPEPVGQARADQRQPLARAASRLFTTREAAAYLAVSEDTLSRWRIVGCGPAFVKFHRAKQGVIRYRPADLDRFIDAHVQTSTSAVG